MCNDEDFILIEFPLKFKQTKCNVENINKRNLIKKIIIFLSKKIDIIYIDFINI